ncbi:MAG: hypothetical protein VX670_11310, partial [Candidatus Latescibacterota bacterium]|nr:hypothetical protein [Candidatus Latescibacterota bacterium]
LSDHLVSDRLVNDHLLSDHLVSDHLVSDHLLSGPSIGRRRKNLLPPPAPIPSRPGIQYPVRATPHSDLI